MSGSNTLQLGGLGAAAIALLGYMVWSKHFSSRLPLPPSPKSYPLIGNLLSMPTKDQHLGFTEIGKHLKSDIISLSTLGNTIIVLNNAEDATNLLEKRSGIYSDRICPPMIAHPSLMAWENHPALMGYSPRWKTYRRLMQPWLHKEAAKKFEPSQQYQARLFLQKLLTLSSALELSADLSAEANSVLAATIAYSSYGYQVKSSDDPFLLRIQTLIDNTNYAALPSNFLVNLFPTLASLPEWLPGMGWKRLAKEWRVQKDDAIDGSYEWAKSHMKNGNDNSIVALMLNHCQRLGMSPDEAEDCGKNIALLLYAGGVETTASAYLVFIVAMILYPDVQKRAQQEIDSVIGPSRLPTMEDRENLPYINRLIQELFRWYPTLPLGVPHVCYKDDEYKGYRIPKGAYVIGNIWAITRNAAVYEDPETFEPDRFLDPSVPPAPNFGFGRRICPGLHYAGASFFILITSTLAAFDIKMYKDENGNSVVPSPNSENTIIHHPKPFKLKLKSRSEAHEALIRSGA